MVDKHPSGGTDRPTERSRLDELVASGRQEMMRPAGEVIMQIYQALLALNELKLSDGKTAKVEAFFPPQEDAEGRLHCGFDLRFANGKHLEFTLKNTGWGKSFVNDELRKSARGKEGRSR